jgi:hypothetical protein
LSLHCCCYMHWCGSGWLLAAGDVNSGVEDIERDTDSRGPIVDDNRQTLTSSLAIPSVEN